MAKHDPTRRQMLKYLKERYQGLVDDWRSEAEVAAWWFAGNYHGGLHSNLYVALSDSPYRPGPTTRLESEGEVVGMMYRDLEDRYGMAGNPSGFWEEVVRTKFAHPFDRTYVEQVYNEIREEIEKAKRFRNLDPALASETAAKAGNKALFAAAVLGKHVKWRSAADKMYDLAEEAARMVHGARTAYWTHNPDRNVTKISPEKRRAINEMLCQYGFDGNRRFGSMAAAVREINDVLDGWGMQIVDMITPYTFPGKSGFKTLIYGYAPREPFYPPTEIENSLLATAYTEMYPDSFEVVAYLS